MTGAQAPRGDSLSGSVDGDDTQALAREIGALAAGRRIFIVSNRGPVEFIRTTEGSLQTRRGAGGVVTALASLGRSLPLTWIAAAMTPGDREAFPTATSPARQVRFGRDTLKVRYVPLPADEYTAYYDVISNNVLWFLQHYLWDPAFAPNFNADIYDCWHRGYVPVNAALVDALVAEVERGGSTGAGGGARRRSEGADAIILLQDYHLYVAAAKVRERLPRAIVQQFVHIPWPAVRYWEFLPFAFVREIYASLARNDVLGFQTPPDARNFLFSAREFLPGSRVDFERGLVHWQGHRVLARAYPVAVDSAEVGAALKTAAGRRGAEEVAAVLKDQGPLIVRVDRLDPTKNIVRGFHAYQQVLRTQPELRGRVRFLAFLVPSRERIPIYRRYQREVRAIIREINAEFGAPGYEPVTAFFENNRARALAAMRRADVLLVNPIIDGMNLVAKEGPAVSAQDGVLVLSRTAGAYAQLGEAALALTPTDIDETARQLVAALEMAPEERARRATQARAVVARESPILWALEQLRDAARVRQANRGPSTQGARGGTTVASTASASTATEGQDASQQPPGTDGHRRARRQAGSA